MAGFMTRRESRKQYESIGGGNFNDAYKTQKDKLRQSGLRGRELRQTARQAVIDDQNLTNIQNMSLQNSEQYAPTEDTIAGMEMRGYDQNEKQMERDNYRFRQNLLNSQLIDSLAKPATIEMPTRVQSLSANVEFGQEHIKPATIEMPTRVQSAQENQNPDYDSMSFNDAFATAYKNLGEGKAFTWRGKQYAVKLKPKQEFGLYNNRELPESWKRAYWQGVRR